MITLNFDTGTGIAKLAQPAIIKVGADVRVKVVFLTAPGAGTEIEWALITDAADPETKAFTDDFTAENATTWTALLDANDTRLVDFMAGKNSVQLNGELVCVIDGERQIAPNVAVAVQPSRATGPGSGVGGPSYATFGVVTFHFAGDVIDETVFGYFKAPSACSIVAAQLFAQDAPTGAALTVDLVNAGGAEQSRVATLAAAATRQETVYGTPLALAAGDVVQAKIKSVGTTIPGQNLTLHLILT